MADNTSQNSAPKFDLEGMTKQWQDMMMDSWGAMTKNMVASDSFAHASSAYMDWALNWQKQMRNNTAQFLDALEFPKRSDIARLSKQLVAVELRVADMEDKLDKMVGLLGNMSEALQRMVAQSMAQPQHSQEPHQPAEEETVPATVATANGASSGSLGYGASAPTRKPQGKRKN